MTVTIELSGDEERRLAERAARLGQDLDAYLRRLIRADLEVEGTGRTFAEILAPVHEDFRRSGMGMNELDALLEGTINESRAERKRVVEGLNGHAVRHQR